MAKVYIAGASVEAAEVAEAYKALREMGHTITLDWATPVLKHRATGGNDATLSRLDRVTHAEADVMAVEDATHIWLRVPKKMSRGCWFEFGLAIGLRRHATTTTGGALRHHGSPQIIISEDDELSIFTEFADKHFNSHADALAYFKKIK